MPDPLNYSKWDNIELSDDEDVEVHPNVDKQSFIRWRQQAIHRERQEREMKIQNLTKTVPIQKELLQEIDKLRDMLSRKDASGFMALVGKLQAHGQQREDTQKRTTTDDSSGNTPPAELTIEDMMAGLVLNIQSQVKPEDVQEGRVISIFEEQLGSHRQRLADQQAQAEKELEKLEKEKRQKLSADDLCRPGFDKTSVNKVNKLPKPATQVDKDSGKKATTTVKSVEVLNSDTLAKQKSADSLSEPSPPVLPMEEIIKGFAECKDIPQSIAYISRYPDIVDEAISDEILVRAFEKQMAGDSRSSLQCVHQGLILQYCARLGHDGVSLFFTRYHRDPRAKAMFEGEVKAMHQRIQERSKVLLEERKNNPQPEDIESIQLQCDDPDAQMDLDLPSEDPTTPEAQERLTLFRTLPDHFQEALKVGTVTKVNESLAKLTGAEAERVLETCNEGGFFSLAGEKIVSPDDE
ncbi:hsp90 co-chaperone Cdc37 [Dispira parvispora]|uniref:Hsp90 chaperone protein kinase-targeting subunit n=1 Tax=Dispira parvispora TaxID=1520584 RepID=A0A9W8ASM0_9FUNG|nr:hsp90 co-chaperone Cdc37 [Dispira parvispora]